MKGFEKMRCPYCNGETRTKDYCEFCGSELPKQTKRTCPRCGSDNITFKRENQGEIRGKRSKQVVRLTVGFCKDCGETWYPNSAKEMPKKKKTWLWVLGWIFIFPLPLTILLLRNKKLYPAVKYGVIAVAWLFYLILAFASGGSESDTNKTDTQEAVVNEINDGTINVFITVKGKQDGSSSFFDIDTNLPDDTELMLTLSNGDVNDGTNYSGQTKVKVFSGKASSEGFSKNGNALVGNFDLVVSMSLPSIQSDAVRNVIGQNGENITGNLVDSSNGTITAYYTASIVNNSVTVSPSTDYKYTIFYEGDYSEFDTSPSTDTQESLSPEAFLGVAKLALNENFGENNYNVDYEDGVGFTFNVWAEGVAVEIAQVTIGDKTVISDWDTMKGQVGSMAESVYKSCKEMTGNDYIVMVNVVNDQNKENTLLSFVNGVCVYDCVDEYR